MVGFEMEILSEMAVMEREKHCFSCNSTHFFVLYLLKMFCFCFFFSGSVYLFPQPRIVNRLRKVHVNVVA